MDEQQPIPQQPIPPYYYEEDTISLSDIMLVLAKQLKLLIITPLVFGVITAFYVLFMVGPTYVSSAKIMSSGGGVQPPSSRDWLLSLVFQFPGAMKGPSGFTLTLLKAAPWQGSYLKENLIRKSMVRKNHCCKY